MGKALFSKTKIQKNSNSIIQNGSSNVVVVQTGIPNVLKFDETRKIDWSIRKIKEMQEICPRRFGVKDSLERAVRIDNYLERILFCSIVFRTISIDPCFFASLSRAFQTSSVPRYTS